MRLCCCLEGQRDEADCTQSIPLGWFIFSRIKKGESRGRVKSVTPKLWRFPAPLFFHKRVNTQRPRRHLRNVFAQIPVTSFLEEWWACISFCFSRVQQAMLAMRLHLQRAEVCMLWICCRVCARRTRPMSAPKLHNAEVHSPWLPCRFVCFSSCNLNEQVAVFMASLRTHMADEDTACSMWALSPLYHRFPTYLFVDTTYMEVYVNARG